MRVAGFEWREIGQPSGGPYDRTNNPKLVWHTWEGHSWAGAEAAFAPYPPHLAVNPRDRRRCQYVDLDRHAYSLAGSDTEDSWVIQIEVAGYAGESHDWPASDLDWLGEAVLAPLVELVPIPPDVAPQGFHGADEGIVLASSSSPIRFSSVGAWDAFAGHVGHQHAPAPDEHWDPGRLDVARIIAASGGATRPTEDDDDMRYYLVVGDDPRGSGEWFVTDLLTKRYCPSLQNAIDTDYWMTQPSLGAGKPLVCNRDARGEVAGPIAARQEWVDSIALAG